MGFYGKQKAQELQERQRKNSGGGKYVKLSDDGDELECAFVGDVYSTYEVWNEDTKRSEEYDEKIHGPEKTAKPSIAVRWNVWDRETRKVRVFKQRTRFFSTWDEQTSELEKDGQKWWYKIRRKGKARDPSTTYSLVPVKQLSEDELNECKNLELYNLAEEASGNSSNNSDDSRQEVLTPSGVQAEKLNKMIGLAKGVYENNPSFLEDFLTRFEVGAIRDVPQGRMDEAFEFIQGYGSPKGASTPPAADDPFAV